MGVNQLLALLVLLVVLAVIASGRFRMDVTALSGLLILGIAGVAPPKIIFSGFGHPALATIIAVFFMSQGIINSEALRGLGHILARKNHSLKGQVLSTAFVGAVLSSIMNNVGAVGLMIPTAARMAKRSGVQPGTFGLPLAMISILGGSVTLIGSAPNIIIASYMMSATGSSFKMFDYAPHGLAMLAVALLTWTICKSCGIDPGGTCSESNEESGHKNNEELDSTLKGSDNSNSNPSADRSFAPLATKARKITLLSILLAIIFVSLGLLHPAFGFGGAVLVMIYFGVLKLPDDFSSVDLKIVFFLGSMLGIGQTLEHTGTLDLLAGYLTEVTAGFSPLALIIIVTFISSALSNAINNSAAAVFMAPLAIGIAAGSSMGTAAALMAVAAGSNMALMLPTHQATLLVLSKAPFSIGSFIRFGAVLTLLCGLAAAGMIALVWQ